LYGVYLVKRTYAEVLADACNSLIGLADSQFLVWKSSLFDFDFLLGAFTVYPMFAVSAFTDNFGHSIHLHPAIQTWLYSCI
jgi:hypothetical protein